MIGGRRASRGCGAVVASRSFTRRSNRGTGPALATADEASGGVWCRPSMVTTMPRSRPVAQKYDSQGFAGILCESRECLRRLAGGAKTRSGALRPNQRLRSAPCSSSWSSPSGPGIKASSNAWTPVEAAEGHGSVRMHRRCSASYPSSTAGFSCSRARATHRCSPSARGFVCTDAVAFPSLRGAGGRGDDMRHPRPQGVDSRDRKPRAWYRPQRP